MEPDLDDLHRRMFLISTLSGMGGVLAAPALSIGLETKQQPSAVTLKEAHIGTLEIDLRIMNQFGVQPQEVQDFYVACRAAMINKNAKSQLVEICQNFKREKLGGPMLGDITPNSVSIWMHLPKPEKVEVIVTAVKGGDPMSFQSKGDDPIQTIQCDGLSPNTGYSYSVRNSSQRVLGEGNFTTVPEELSQQPFRIGFGADFHKIGMYRPELMKLIRERGSRAMLLIGDSAVDGRKDDYGLIGADYLLRNLSPSIQNLTANVPVYATWDDHDYWGNDVSGNRTPKKDPIDVDGLRRTWKKQWNNPQRQSLRDGIYFQTKIGPVHFIALDTRSCRLGKQRGKLNSFLGPQQMGWLKKTLAESTSPFILISSGTMWTDFISDGKDSWGVWDKEGREEIFQLIDTKHDSHVMLLSGDRHGARGFTIERPGGKTIHEFEVGTLGGVPGPKAFGDDRSSQLFGLPSKSWAFGEFTFSSQAGKPTAVFRLINQQGKVLEKVTVGSE